MPRARDALERQLARHFGAAFWSPGLRAWIMRACPGWFSELGEDVRYADVCSSIPPRVAVVSGSNCLANPCRCLGKSVCPLHAAG
ncbi:MAG: hypothetical protein ACJ8KO_06135, partial [Sulfurifustaceae bacterium]